MDLLNDFIGILKKEIADQSIGNSEHPKAEPFEHGVQVGKYQGLKTALQRLEALLNDEEQKERKR